MQPISRDELNSMNQQQKRDFVLINVLPREQFLKKHIRTSINIPAGEADFAGKVEEVAGSKDRDIVVYCASFECNASPDAGRKLEQSGFRNVFDYEGGTRDWFEPKSDGRQTAAEPGS